MKNINLLAFTIMLLFSNPAGAQKSTWMIYGNGGYDNMNYTPNANNNTFANTPSPLSITGWSANAGAGCMVSNHFMIGLQGGYGNQEEITENYYFYYPNPYPITPYENKERVTSWQAGVFGRYTTSLGKRFFVYSQLFAGKYGVNTENEPTSTNGVTPPYTSTSVTNLPDGNGFIFNLFPAVGMNVIKGYGLNLSIGGVSYTTYNSTSSNSDLHHFNVTLGQQFSFGLQKVIGWRKLDAPPTAPPAAG